MLVAVVAALQALQITVIIEPLNAVLIAIFGYLPRLLGAGILVVLAWLVATALRLAVRELLAAVGLDKRASELMAEERRPPISVARAVGDVVYWLVFIFFLPAILGALGIEGLLDPVRDMVGEILAFLPNLLGAALILLVGWFVARIVRRLVTNFLVATRIDDLSERIGLARILGGQQLSALIGLIVYAFIFVPVVLGALTALRLDSVTQPTSAMLYVILQAIPRIFAAALILIVAFVVGRVVSQLIANLLTGAGFDRLPARLGIGGPPAEGARTPSQIAGYVVLAAIMVFAAMEAGRFLGLELFAGLVSEFLVFAAKVAFGLIIFGLGLFLANVAARAIQASGIRQRGFFAVTARISILILAGAIALRAMGFANEIIIVAFALPLGAVAVAFAIAFGVGSREIAARELDGWIRALRGGGSQG